MAQGTFRRNSGRADNSVASNFNCSFPELLLTTLLKRFDKL
jgi:hypothetical protein